jgi:Na+/proline symporter
VVASFVLCLLGFTLLGISSARASRGTRHDYYLADGTVPPWLVGLSAVATNNSGYMFIGVIGYTYATGFPAIWLMLGWLLGDFLGSTFIHAKLRAATQNCDEVSYAGVLARWHGERNTALQRTIGAISLLFLISYAGAQLLAGSKALHVLFEWPLWAGAVLGSVLVVAYCFAGGIRASIWTDAAQSMVMIVAMALLLVVAVVELGGFGAAWAQWKEIPEFTRWTPQAPGFLGWTGGPLFVLGWMAAGLSVIGQPHVMVRFMTLSEGPSGMRRARTWYYLWFTAFYFAATAVGLLSRLYLADSGDFDAELALPTMALELLPGVLVGVILAGIFAATMSTADSLILSCSAALTHDLLPHRIERPLLIKASTVLMTAGALVLALSGSDSVFALVILSWSALASAFAPLLIALALGARPSQARALTALAVGLGVSLLWRQLGWESVVYEGLPGIAAGLLVHAVPAAGRKVLNAAESSA